MAKINVTGNDLRNSGMNLSKQQNYHHEKPLTSKVKDIPMLKSEMNLAKNPSSKAHILFQAFINIAYKIYIYIISISNPKPIPNTCQFNEDPSLNP